MWIVKLTKNPQTGDYRSNYFPRRFHYKRDAEKLKIEVEKNGGEATVEKEKSS